MSRERSADSRMFCFRGFWIFCEPVTGRDRCSSAAPTSPALAFHQLNFEGSDRDRRSLSSHGTLPLGCLDWGGGGGRGVAIRDEQMVHSDFDLISVEAAVDPDTVADPSSALSGSDREK